MLDYTGERMVPEAAEGSTFWEHVERYRFAIPYARGRRVLDIACGEGYGTAALAASGASSIIGVDISPETCAHARDKYRIDARAGSAGAIPLPDACVDVVVSFETIEHLERPDDFLKECHRVLVPSGRLIVSTPNRPVYHLRSPSNAFHHHEMTLDEFQDALSQQFHEISLLGQCSPLPSLLRLRGVRRLPTAFYRAFVPHVVDAPSEFQRANVLDWIRRPSTWRDRFDPFAVRRLSGRRLQTQCYLVAVATRNAA